MRDITIITASTKAIAFGLEETKRQAQITKSEGVLENASLRTQTTPYQVLRRVSTLVVFACYGSCTLTPAVLLSGLPR